MKKSVKTALGITLAATCLVGSLSLSGCSSKSSSGDDDGKTLKIAMCAPLTGDNAKAAIEFQDAANMALSEVDYNVAGYNLEVTWVDVTTEPDKGALALEQAYVRDGVDVSLFSWTSTVGLALMDVAAKYEIPHYFGLSASSGVSDKYLSDPDKYSYWIGKGWPVPSILCGSYAEFVSEITADGTWEPRNQKLAILCDDTEFGRDIGESVRASFEEIGWEVVYEDYVAMNVTDLYTPLNMIKASDASLYIGTYTNPAQSAAFVKQAREVNLNALLVADAITEGTSWYELAGESTQYCLDSRAILSSEKALEFEAAFEEMYGYTPSASAGGHVYDYTRFFFDVIEAIDANGDEVNSETLYDFGVNVLQKGGLTFEDGVTAETYMFTEESMPDLVVGEGMYTYPIEQLVDGNIEVVWPESAKTADFVVPDYAK